MNEQPKPPRRNNGYHVCNGSLAPRRIPAAEMKLTKKAAPKAPIVKTEAPARDEDRFNWLMLLAHQPVTPPSKGIIVSPEEQQRRWQQKGRVYHRVRSNGGTLGLGWSWR